MKKKELLALSIPSLITELTIQDKTVEKRKSYCGREYTTDIANYIYTAVLDKSTGEDVLIFDLYRPSGEHIRRHFQTEDGYFSITEDGKLSKAGLDKALTWYDMKYYCDDITEQVVSDFLKPSSYAKKSKTALDLLQDSNRKSKEGKLKAKYDKIRKSIADEMLEIRELPKSVTEWAKKDLLKAHRFIFYRSIGKKKVIGKCSWCGKAVEFEREKGQVKNEGNGKCPHCKSEIVYKSEGNQSNCGFSKEKSFCYLQSTSEGFCARYFRATRNFSPVDGWTWEDHFHECDRGFYVFNEATSRYTLKSFFDWGEFKQTGIYEWCRGDFPTSDYGYTIFPNNLNKLLKHDRYGAWHTDLNKLARNCSRLGVRALIEKPQKYVIIGHLANAGLYRLAGSVMESSGRTVRVNVDAKSLKAFGISKNEIPIFRKLNPSLDRYELYRSIQEREKNVDIDEFFLLVSLCGGRVYYVKKALQKTTLHQLVKYIKLQQANGIDKGENICNLWVDYLGNAQLLGFDMQKSAVKFPKNLKIAHDTAYQAVNAAEKTEGGLQIVAIAKMEQELNERFYFETRKYLIRAPRDHHEVIAEGEKLCHCVARYAKDIGRGKKIILFIREKESPEIPFFTLELSPDLLEVNQNLGLKNCVPPPQVEAFVEKWLAERVLAGSQRIAV